MGGVAGELAGANAVRNPGRTASTAAALMIGITLVTLVAVLGSSLSKATTSAIKEEVHAGYVIDSPEGLPFRADGGDALARSAGVKGASHVRSDQALVDGKQRIVTGIDPATIARFYHFKWTAGSLSKLGTDGAIVTKKYASSHHLAIGKPLALTLPSGEKRTLVVRGDPRPQDAADGRRRHDPGGVRHGVQEPQEQPDVPGRRSRGRAGRAQGHPATSAAPASTPGPASRRTPRRRWPSVLAMLYVLLGFSVLVSLFGMVNTLVLSVFERTREIGMLRAIGMTPRQSRRMIRHESIITALIGAALGLGLGTALASLVMIKWDVPIAIPFSALLALHADRRARRRRRRGHARPPRVAAERAEGAAIRVSARRGCLKRHRPPPAGPIAPPGSRREARGTMKSLLLTRLLLAPAVFASTAGATVSPPPRPAPRPSASPARR